MNVKDEEPVGSLDEAWRDAEAALPAAFSLTVTSSRNPDGWTAIAWPWGVPIHENPPQKASSFGPTPTAALQALTALLRDKAVSR